MLPWAQTAPPWPLLVLVISLAGMGVTLLLRARTKLRRTLALFLWVILFGTLVSAMGGGASETGQTVLLVAVGAALVGFSAWICTDAVAILEVRRIWISPLLFAQLAGCVGLISVADLIGLLVWNSVIGAASLAMVLLILRERGAGEPVRALIVLEGVGLAAAVLALGLLGDQGAALWLDAGADLSGIGQPISAGLALLIFVFVLRALCLVISIGLVAGGARAVLSAELALAGMAMPAVLYVLHDIFEVWHGALPVGARGIAMSSGLLLLFAGGFCILGARTRGWRVAFLCTSLVGLGLAGAAHHLEVAAPWVRLYSLLWFAPVPVFLVATSVLDRLGGWSAQGAGPDQTALAGLMRPALVLAALALGGLPPFAGFWPRLILFEEAWREAHYLILALLVLGVIVVLAALARRLVDPPTDHATGRGGGPARAIALPELVVLGLASGLTLAGSFYPRPLAEWGVGLPQAEPAATTPALPRPSFGERL